MTRWLSLMATRMVVGLVCAGLLVISGCKEEICTVDSECSPGTYCLVVTGKCISDCSGDSECQASQHCQDGRCVTKGETCEPKKVKRCAGSRLYWFDSCGYQGEVIEDCGSAGCVDDQCKSNEKSCGNGVCEPGTEDCLSCAQDCKCTSGETCENGVCKSTDTCGNGTCDQGTEDCSTCSQDCACGTGKLCENGTCQEGSSCGDGKCDSAKNENCLSCPRDCPCPQGETCASGTATCQAACGNGKCDLASGENCSTCAQDCGCQTGQGCMQGRCEVSCGNGKCESVFGENCSTCAKDCACATGQPCSNGSCGASCGNGSCQADKGENCSTCAQDCKCTSKESCVSGKCTSQCGDGVCKKEAGEDCTTCAQDCKCGSGLSCVQGVCQGACGDGKCDAGGGENCSTCAADCKCPSGKACVGGSCSCTPNCNGKNCGADGCGGTCGKCSGRTTCQNGTCECTHECPKQGESTCKSTSQYERCDLDGDGCRYRKTLTCIGARECKNGSCCASSCAGKACGDDGCGSSCGSCPSLATCQSGQCVCNHACPKEGDRKCDAANGYVECLKDPASGCRKWSPTRTCTGGTGCINGNCCKPLCSGKECGTDGCGGTCGSCAYGCVSNTCRRQFLAVSLYLPCGLCDDNGSIGSYKKPDPYFKLTLGTGQTYKSPEKGNTCGSTLTYQWTVSNLTAASLKNAKLEVFDGDPLNSDDLCVTWSGDFSVAGKRTLTATSSNNAKVTIEIKK